MSKYNGLSCDLLEKSYLCGINNNCGSVSRLRREVVICLKSLTFVVSITTIRPPISEFLCCDLLEKSYLCGINNNEMLATRDLNEVVICLKSLTFVVSITTLKLTPSVRKSCDLLEKSYLCGINNNQQPCMFQVAYVVICLKSLTFVVSITTDMW